MKNPKKITALFLSVCMVFASTVLLSSCANKNQKEIKITYVNWLESIAFSNIAKKVFEGQGYKVTLMNADVAPVFASLSRKKADIFMNVWTPKTHKNYLEKYGDKLEFINQNFDNARIGLVVPEYVTINNISELSDSKEKFKNEITGIDAGAGIMIATQKVIKDYDLDFKLLTSSEPAMIAAMKRAIQQKKWIVITGWMPHWMFAKFDLKFLNDDKGVYGEAEKIQTYAWKGFSEKDPFAAKLLKNIHFTNDQMSTLLKTFEETDNEGEAAQKWIDENSELVDSWIPEKE